MLIYTYQKSKKRKIPKAKQEAHDKWIKNLPTTNFAGKYGITKKSVEPLSAPKPYVRETPHYPSLNTSVGSCTKPAPKVYTGTNILGIGTLHKSNAVPIFSKEEAQDQASMRR